MYSVKLQWIGADEKYSCRYVNMDAVKVHGGSEHFKAWSKAVGPLLAGPPVIKYASQIGGFESKSKL